jgi:hypothetical protein
VEEESLASKEQMNVESTLRQKKVLRKSLFQNNASTEPPIEALEIECKNLEEAELSSIEIMKEILESSSFKRMDSRREEIVERSKAVKVESIKPIRGLVRAASRVLDINLIASNDLPAPKETAQNKAPYKKFLTKIQTIRETVTSKAKEKTTETRLMPITKVAPLPISQQNPSSSFPSLALEDEPNSLNKAMQRFLQLNDAKKQATKDNSIQIETPLTISVSSSKLERSRRDSTQVLNKYALTPTGTLIHLTLDHNKKYSRLHLQLQNIEQIRKTEDSINVIY